VGDLAFLDLDFQRLRLVKSAEELEWVGRGAELTDAAVDAFVRRAGPGTREAELGAWVRT
jgi:Xaa-Pro aminopeptidase